MIGITFSPDGKWAYVTDTGSGAAFYPPTLHGPATMYVGLPRRTIARADM